MRPRLAFSSKAPIVRRTPIAQLPLQVTPLILELAGGDLQLHASPRKVDAGAIEGVAALLRLVGDRMKVGRDGGAAPLKANQLRVMRVAARPPGEHSLSQKSLPPNRDQSFDV